jgi:hypothetical protein
MDQQDEQDTRDDYTIGFSVAAYADMPMPEFEGFIVHVTAVNRDYITIKNDVGFYWWPIGRLKPKRSGKQQLEIKFDVLVPANIYNASLFFGPKFSVITEGASEFGMLIYPMTDIYVSIYRGTVVNTLITTLPFQIDPIPFLSGDQWNISETVNLTAESLYTNVYSEYITWKTSRNRGFTKFLSISLQDLIALEWGKRYTISGVKVILSRINYDIPYRGIAQVQGYAI